MRQQNQKAEIRMTGHLNFDTIVMNYFRTLSVTTFFAGILSAMAVELSKSSDIRTKAIGHAINQLIDVHHNLDKACSYLSVCLDAENESENHTKQ